MKSDAPLYNKTPAHCVARVVKYPVVAQLVKGISDRDLLFLPKYFPEQMLEQNETRKSVTV